MSWRPENEGRAGQSRKVPQPDFRSSPYTRQAWEIIGTLTEVPCFEPLACPIIGEASLDDTFSPAAFEVAGIAQMEMSQGSYSSGEQVVSDAAALTPELVAEQLKEEFEEGRAEGYHDGFEQGKAAGRAEVEEVMNELQRFQSVVSERVEEFIRQSERNCVALSLKIAKRLLLTTAEAKPEYILEVVRTGLKAIGAAKPLRIRVSTQDFEFLEVIGMPPELSTHELGAEYVLDEAIKAGCVIETQFGEVDLQLDKMWEQVAAELFEATK